MHAVSVGEIHAIAGLAKKLKEEIEHLTLVISSTTETGHAEAKKTLALADAFVYLPFDFWFCVKKVLSRCTPDIVILSEGDLWYHFLHEAKKKGAITLITNGKMSKRSAARMTRFSYFGRKLVSLIDHFCLQNELYKQRFIQTGVPVSKVSITGNSKADALPQPLQGSAIDELKQKLGVKTDDLVLVIGSTHDPEEELLLKEIAPLIQQFDRLKVIIAPRHPERFGVVSALIEAQGLSYASWTKGATSDNPQVFLVDTMGVLRHCYQLADVAIVAGSFTTKIGGHNILEAQCFGIPVITGPYMYSQPQLIENALAHNAIIQTDINGIQGILENLLSNAERRSEISKNALEMIAAMKGSTQATLSVIHDMAPQFFGALLHK
jgi:3-deoxy-D-manno-octulosonic-acid transferase